MCPQMGLYFESCFLIIAIQERWVEFFWQCGDKVRHSKDSLRLGAFIFLCILKSSVGRTMSSLLLESSNGNISMVVVTLILEQ